MIHLSALFKKYNGICVYCDGKTYFRLGRSLSELCQRFPDLRRGERGAKRKRRYFIATREHMVRKTDGGNNEQQNLVLACAYCNSCRGDATPDQHRAAMQKLVEEGRHPVNRKTPPVVTGGAKSQRGGGEIALDAQTAEGRPVTTISAPIT